MSLITLSGGGMVGVPGFSRRLFTALSYNKINVSLITQASSEHSITEGIEDELVKKAKQVIEEEFEMDFERGTLNPISHTDSLSIIALVGDQMENHTGISGRAFHTLGRNGINIIAIAQGSSERNISIVIESKDVKKGLRALHESFFDVEPKQVNVFAIGVGNVGGTLLEQIRTQRNHLIENQNIEINVIGLSNSKKMLLESEGLDLEDWKNELANSDIKASTETTINMLNKLNLRNCVMIDNTANEQIALSYPHFLEKSIGVVASNKIAAAQPMDGFRNLKKLSVRHGAPYLYETNVGASLPIIDTIQNIISSGDEVLEIQAILSGSLNFIFNSFSSQKTFKSVVQEAMDLGFTEPDPRIDISGVDVQRKILILCRESGLDMEMSDVQNIPFLSDKTMSGSVSEFLSAIQNEEEQMLRRLEQATAENKRLKYLASFKDGQARVGLDSVNSEHPFYSVEGSDNIISIRTKRYNQPLIIRGAGAGAEVTAMGVFADIIKIANRD
ncbi:MAG: ACT domain-containing protein [Flavobacteriales bacterium]|nr:ACT domain-containing protein [Flavobacteriales bacterium]